MTIQKYSLGQLQANCYFLIEDNQCLIIDPADEADFILEKIQRENLELIGLIATHGHFDHVMAAGEIQLSFPVPLYLHPDDAFLIKRLTSTAKHFLGYEPAVVEPNKIMPIKKGPWKIRPFNIETILTPGHTPGSCCFYIKGENTVFTGDTLFRAGIGRYDFAYSDKDKLFASIAKLYQLPEETIIYSGHGEETTIDEEKNPLRDAI